jgi:CheY-like chemotaxis protein
MRPTCLRVLVVDDMPDNRETLGLLVAAWGHETLLAHDGPSALEAFAAFRPHAVLLDIGLPGFDGWEVARLIRRHEGRTPALVVAVTGYGRERDREQSREAGIDLHLTKPADPEVLRRVLAEVDQATPPAAPPSTRPFAPADCYPLYH